MRFEGERLARLNCRREEAPPRGVHCRGSRRRRDGGACGCLGCDFRHRSPADRHCSLVARRRSPAGLRKADRLPVDRPAGLRAGRAGRLGSCDCGRRVVGAGDRDRRSWSRAGQGSEAGLRVSVPRRGRPQRAFSPSRKCHRIFSIPPASGRTQIRSAAGRCRKSAPSGRSWREARAIRPGGHRGARARSGSMGGRRADLRAVGAVRQNGAPSVGQARCPAGWRRWGTIRSPNCAQLAAALRAEGSSTRPSVRQRRIRPALIQPRAGGILRSGPKERWKLRWPGAPEQSERELEPGSALVPWFRLRPPLLLAQRAPGERTDFCIRSGR